MEAITQAKSMSLDPTTWDFIQEFRHAGVQHQNVLLLHLQGSRRSEARNLLPPLDDGHQRADHQGSLAVTPIWIAEKRPRLCRGCWAGLATSMLATTVATYASLNVQTKAESKAQYSYTVCYLTSRKGSRPGNLPSACTSCSCAASTGGDEAACVADDASA